MNKYLTLLPHFPHSSCFNTTSPLGSTVTKRPPAQAVRWLLLQKAKCGFEGFHVLIFVCITT